MMLINAITPISAYSGCKLHQRNLCRQFSQFIDHSKVTWCGCMRRPVHCWRLCPTVGL